MDVKSRVSTYISLLKDCAKKKDLHKGVRLHNEVMKHDLIRTNQSIATTLVCMYAKCGNVPKARSVFDETSFPEFVSWNVLISAYIQHGQFPVAFNFLTKMLNEGLPPDIVSYICILKACAKTRDIRKGKEVHSTIVISHSLEKDIALGNALIDMYAKCGALQMAQQMFEELPHRDVISWNALIGGYNQYEQSHEALNCFDQMQKEGLSPDAITFTCILKACGSSQDIESGKQIHEEAESRGLVDNDIVLGNALVDMYVKCGMLPKALKVLKDLPIRDTVSWSTLISGYAHNGECDNAFRGFECMQNEGLAPNIATFVCILKACGNTGALSMGRKMHEEIINRGLMGKNCVLHNALVDMYAKCGVPEKAQEVLEELPLRDVVTWSSLISGYAQQGQSHEALDCFERMQREGFSPNTITFLCVLRACGNLGAIYKGNQIHKQICEGGFLHKDIMLGTALVDMYAKCGSLAKAQEVLEELSGRDLISWSVLIAGYAQQGQSFEAFSCFERMRSEGFTPDKVTFQCLLSACSHSGLMGEAQFWLRNMTQEYNMIPDLQHRACMVVVFGSMGLFAEAISMTKVMTDSLEVCLTVLSACKKWGNVKQVQKISP